jgi:NAD(P)-dependent dehydrogenase (short-subunit alcohol dehydrogenase family)
VPMGTVFLHRRTAIVTGSGGTGCCRASALCLAAEGATVVVSDTDTAWREETHRLIEAAGGSAAFRLADVGELKFATSWAADGQLGATVSQIPQEFRPGLRCLKLES